MSPTLSKPVWTTSASSAIRWITGLFVMDGTGVRLTATSPGEGFGHLSPEGVVTDFTATLHVGPSHVCVRVNETFRAWLPGRQTIGCPAREAFPEPEYAPLIALMDAVYRDGEARWTRFRGNLYGVLPRLRAGRLIGVSTVYQLPVPRALPRLRLLPRSRRASHRPAARSLERVG